ncbi:hypothetical protein ACWD4K_22655 [Streptomyces gelaticus]
MRRTAPDPAQDRSLLFGRMREGLPVFRADDAQGRGGSPAPER